jgi:hypothetical protein
VQEKWQQLSAEQKEPFETLSKEDKVRYAKEMEAFKEAHPELCESASNSGPSNPMSKFTVKGLALPKGPFSLSTISPNETKKAKKSKKPKVLLSIKLLEPLPPLKGSDKLQIVALMSKLQVSFYVCEQAASK